jgi:hypothetical protein
MKNLIRGIGTGVRTHNQASGTFIVLPPCRPALFLIGRLVWVVGRAVWAAFWF